MGVFFLRIRKLETAAFVVSRTGLEGKKANHRLPDLVCVCVKGWGQRESKQIKGLHYMYSGPLFLDSPCTLGFPSPVAAAVSQQSNCFLRFLSPTHYKTNLAVLCCCNKKKTKRPWVHAYITPTHLALGSGDWSLWETKPH